MNKLVIVFCVISVLSIIPAFSSDYIVSQSSVGRFFNRVLNNNQRYDNYNRYDNNQGRYNRKYYRNDNRYKNRESYNRYQRDNRYYNYDR